MNAVIGVVYSVGADRALAWTVRAMHTHHDKLVLLTVTELVESSALSQFEEFLHAQIKFNEELEKHSGKLLQEAESKCRHAHVHDVTTVTLRGDPKYEIEEWVKGAVVDNVVLSRRGTGDRESSDVGGVSDYLVAKLPTNVIVVK
jgi:nucleotide-binding universal stress UspA family protein